MSEAPERIWEPYAPNSGLVEYTRSDIAEQGKKDWLETAKALSLRVKAAEQQLAEKDKEIERISELLWGSRCVYCGEIVGKDKKNQDLADDVLKAHVKACKKHPLYEAEQQLKAKDKEIARLREALFQHRWDLHCGSDRPCPTCRQSAEALGLKVPDRCAREQIDKQALTGG